MPLNDRQLDIASGKAGLPRSTTEKYRARWEAAGHELPECDWSLCPEVDTREKVPTIAVPSPGEPSGPGTEFDELRKTLKLEPKAGCTCGAVKNEMDTLGVIGCRRERGRLLEEIRKNYERYTVAEKSLSAFRAFTSGLAFRLNPTDPLGSLFDEAVRRAEKSETLPPGLWDDVAPGDEDVRRRFALEWNR